MFDMFSEEARSVIAQATDEAIERRDDHVGTEHLLLGVMRAGVVVGGSVTLEGARAALDELVGSPVATDPAVALAPLGIDLGAVESQLADTFGADALAPSPPPYDEAARQALMAAVAGATDGEVDTSHVLRAALDVDGSMASQILSVLNRS